jgi:hypothetical protein
MKITIQTLTMNNETPQFNCLPQRSKDEKR